MLEGAGRLDACHAAGEPRRTLSDWSCRRCPAAPRRPGRFLARQGPPRDSGRASPAAASAARSSTTSRRRSWSTGSWPSTTGRSGSRGGPGTRTARSPPHRRSPPMARRWISRMRSGSEGPTSRSSSARLGPQFRSTALSVLFELPAPSRLENGWIVQWTDPEGRGVEAAVPAADHSCAARTGAAAGAVHAGAAEQGGAAPQPPAPRARPAPGPPPQLDRGRERRRLRCARTHLRPSPSS